MATKDSRNPKFKSSSLLRSLALYIIVLVLGIAAFLSFYPTPNSNQKPLGEVLNVIKEGKAQKIVVNGDVIKVEQKDGTTIETSKEKTESFVQTLKASDIDPKTVPFEIKDNATSEIIFSLLNLFLPIIVIVGIFYFLMRQARTAGDSLFSFAKSKAKVFNKDKPSIKFADVAGVDEVKQELTEVVDFLKHPEKYRALGAKIPKGVLLIGPAGVGKTLLARAVAGEAGVPFFSIAGSEFMEMLVGVGASRVRDLFETAKKANPAIIFIDEIDSIGRQRGLGLGGGHDEREQTLNQILVEMDGFEATVNVIVMAATNRPDMLDPALVRPGRFDRRVSLDLPDIQGRKEIIKIHAKNKPLAKDFNIEALSKRTVGFSGADLENMLNEAAILAARNGRKEITNHDLEEAALKVKMGPEKRKLQSEDDRKMTAYHEGGHALVTRMLPHMDPVHRVSIVARGMALGFTMIPPAFDRYQETKTRLEEIITSLLGGRAAEDLIFKEWTVGASSDIEKATQIARQMVTQYGMSDLGPVTLGLRDDMPWVARDMGESKNYSEVMAAKIDVQVSKIIDSAFERAKKILRENKAKLDQIADELMKRETLDGPEFEALFVPVKTTSRRKK